jgi:hypothetical protein
VTTAPQLPSRARLAFYRYMNPVMRFMVRRARQMVVWHGTSQDNNLAQTLNRRLALAWKQPAEPAVISV